MGNTCGKKPTDLKGPNSQLRSLNAGYDNTQRLNLWEVLKETKEIERFLISWDLSLLLQERRNLWDIIHGIRFSSANQVCELVFNIYNTIEAEEKVQNLAPEYKAVSDYVCSNLFKILQEDLVKFSKLDLQKITKNDLPQRLLELMVDTYQMLMFVKRFPQGADDKKWWNVKQYGPKLEFLTSRFIELDGKIKYELEINSKSTLNNGSLVNSPELKKRFSSGSAKPLTQPPLSNLLNAAAPNQKAQDGSDDPAYLNDFAGKYLSGLYQQSYLKYHTEIKALMNKLDLDADINQEEKVHNYYCMPIKVKA